MSKKKELSYDSNKNLGDINITTSVLETIAAKAASEVPGVLIKDRLQKIKGSFMGLDRGRISADIDWDESGFTQVNIKLSVAYGYSVPDIALEVQNRVRDQILYMTDLVMDQVNVHILAIETDTQRQQAYYHIADSQGEPIGN